MRQLLALLALVAIAGCTGSVTASPSFAPSSAPSQSSSAPSVAATATAEPSPSPTLRPGTCLIVPQQYCGTAAIVMLNFSSKPVAGAPQLAYVGLTLPAGTPIFAPDRGTLRRGGIQPAFDAAGHEHDLPMRGLAIGAAASPSALWTLVVSPTYTTFPDSQVSAGEVVATASADQLVGHTTCFSHSQM